MTEIRNSTVLLLALLASLGMPRAALAGDAAASSLSLAEARQYMVALINRDREKCGLPAVEADELANRAGQLHADDMARAGYLSHWDSAGRKPDQRYTELGGKGFVMENCHMEFSGFSEDDTGVKKAVLSENPRFDRETIEKIESGFFNEKPPADGHRRNIIDPHHNRVGIGLSVSAFGQSQRLTCTQEFVNSYFELEDIPGKVTRGETFVVKGVVPDGLALHGIDLYFEEPPRPMTVKELDETQSYGPPAQRVESYFPRRSAAASGIAVTANGARQEFSLTVSIDSASWKPGLCYVYIWARKGDGVSKEVFLVSSRTVVVE